MEIKDLITAIIAIYGATLSTYNLIVARTERIRRVTVTLSWGLTGSGSAPVTIFLLTAANAGKRPVTIANWHLLLPNKKRDFCAYP